MKKVLFATTAIAAAALAGQASAKAHASVGVSGSAEFGYYADSTDAIEDGRLDGEAGVNFTANAALDNGVNVEMSYGFDIDTDDTTGGGIFDGDEDFVVTITGGFGKVVYGADNYAGAAGGVDDEDGNEEDTLYFETNLGPAMFAVSGSLDSDTQDDFEVGISGDAGNFNWGLGYHNESSTTGVVLGTTLGAVTLGLEADSNENWEISAGYSNGFSADVSINQDSVIDVEFGFMAGNMDITVGADDITEEAGDMDPFFGVSTTSGMWSFAADWSESNGAEAKVAYDLGGGSEINFTYNQDEDGDDDDDYDAGFQAIFKHTF